MTPKQIRSLQKRPLRRAINKTHHYYSYNKTIEKGEIYRDGGSPDTRVHQDCLEREVRQLEGKALVDILTPKKIPRTLRVTTWQLYPNPERLEEKVIDMTFGREPMSFKVERHVPARVFADYPGDIQPTQRDYDLAEVMSLAVVLSSKTY